MMDPMATSGYTTRKVSDVDRSQALKRAVTTGKQVRITPGQAKAIVRDVRPARSK